MQKISTHAPLAGRDSKLSLFAQLSRISTHAPLAGRDKRHHVENVKGNAISTHAPLAGRDYYEKVRKEVSRYFNPRAPCGARLLVVSIGIKVFKFQPTRPLRGATRIAQPCRSGRVHISTHAPLAGRDLWGCAPFGLAYYISTHAPLAGRDDTCQP